MKIVIFKLFVIVSLSFLFATTFAQQSSSAVRQKLKKLNFLGSILYVAAHPDDENTRVIAMMSKGRLAETAYLSMTRGDGGQNLIGQETSEMLGLIRTQELLAARRIDGGYQFFTHANDFGFSKSAEEALRLWGKEQTLLDVVRVYRTFQPDIIITRFPPDERAGHGHHTASAMLAQEAFSLAAQESFQPNLGHDLGAWKPSAIYVNTGRWWNNTINEDTPGITVVDVGGYNPLLGESYSEIAARSRSQHKSQGFGSKGTRGYQPEFLEFVAGRKASKDIFEHVNTTWARVRGGEKIQPLVDLVLKEFDESNPSKSITKLIEIRKAISALENGVWPSRKLREVEELIVDCAGIYVAVSSDRFWVNPQGNVIINVELVNRSEASVSLERIKSYQLSMDSTVALPLLNNKPVTFKSRRQLATTIDYSSPYWLTEKHPIGSYTIKNEAMIGKAENEAALQVEFSMTIQGEVLVVTRDVQFRETDPVKGELVRPVEVVPPVFVNTEAPVIIFNDEKGRKVRVKITSTTENKLSVSVSLVTPAGWKTQPLSLPIELSRRGQEAVADFVVTPPKQESQEVIRANAEIEGKVYSQSVKIIEYDHIPTQTLLSPAEIKVVRLNVEKRGAIVGYIKGPGDDMPAAIRNLGYTVVEFNTEELTSATLAKLDAVVIGIRALNTNDRLIHQMPVILDYIKNGGTVVAQYNNSEANASNYAPYPITLSRDRVTEEDAEVTFLDPTQGVLNFPNKITASDFSGWAQERGLYFPDKWDSAFKAVLSMNDKGEKPKTGSLLIARYGKGYYVYTGLSFFRQLPAAVPGAYKLFANILSIGKKN